MPEMSSDTLDELTAENAALRARLEEYEVKKPKTPRWRHRNRGRTYTIIANAQVQTDTPLSDYAEVIIYKSEADGKVWVRPVAEFQERFDEIDEPAARAFLTDGGAK